jgi:hypothetical protein
MQTHPIFSIMLSTTPEFDRVLSSARRVAAWTSLSVLTDVVYPFSCCQQHETSVCTVARVLCYCHVYFLHFRHSQYETVELPDPHIRQMFISYQHIRLFIETTHLIFPWCSHRTTEYKRPPIQPTETKRVSPSPSLCFGHPHKESLDPQTRLFLSVLWSPCADGDDLSIISQACVSEKHGDGEGPGSYVPSDTLGYFNLVGWVIGLVVLCEPMHRLFIMNQENES